MEKEITKGNNFPSVSTFPYSIQFICEGIMDLVHTVFLLRGVYTNQPFDPRKFTILLQRYNHQNHEK